MPNPFFKNKKIPCKTHLLVRGLLAGEDLVKFANDTGIDEIVIGIKRRSRVGKLLFGSTAQYTILKCDLSGAYHQVATFLIKNNPSGVQGSKVSF
jgi:hypothetical protein